MNWTVLGGQGVIGSHLVTRLRVDGEQVWVPERDDPAIFERDLGQVIYAIGLTADFRQRPHETVQAHVTVVSEVLRRAKYSSLLYLSSTRVYARSEDTREDAVLQVSPGEASDLYNLSKLMGEALCLQTDRACVRVVRLSNVVGGDEATSDNFVPSLVREASAGRILLRSAPTSAKDYIHIADVTALLPRIASGGRQRIYNVASGQQTTHAQWADVLQRRTGCAVDIAPGAPQMGFAPICVQRLQHEFPFRPRAALSILD